MGAPVPSPENENAVSQDSFRNYRDSARQANVEALYKANHAHQSLDLVKEKKREFAKLDKFEMSIWQALMMLTDMVDESDPDTELPQIMHALQTAESLRMQFPGEQFEWLHLVGFIHDLGKVLSSPLIGEPQWAVVGDTFPVGCQHSKSIVFYDEFRNNPDWNNPEYNTTCGIYHEGIGMDNVHFSWGHDEYMYQVLKGNPCNLPPIALKVIRYHSFYSWHQHGAYTHLMNEEDKETLHWVKQFQKHDLYSKLPEKPDMEKLSAHYKGLIKKFFPVESIKW